MFNVEENLRERCRKLQAEVDRQSDEIDEWKTASGLATGGCPEGITPRNLDDYVTKLSRVVISYDEFLAWMKAIAHNLGTTNRNETQHHIRLAEELIADLPREEE